MAKVTIEKHGERLRLRWRHEGKRYTMACGVPDNPVGRGQAGQLKARIETDISAGYFDPTLMKYRPRILGPNPTEISGPDLFSKWTAYVFKEKGLSPRSIECRYKPLENALRRSLNIEAHKITKVKAQDFAAVCCEQLTPQTAKARLWLLQSCWEWARDKYHIASENPWKGIATSIQATHVKTHHQPFTPEEISDIKAGFKSSRYYGHYYDLVCFLFAVACRPGEAFGLRWRDVADDFSYVIFRVAVSRGKYVKTTKTKKSRRVVLRFNMPQLMRDRWEQMQHNPNDLVFPSPTGKPISDHTFRRRAWKKVLASVDVPYRPVYCIRHTAITAQVEAGAPPHALAQQTGHSVRTLQEIYVHPQLDPFVVEI